MFQTVQEQGELHQDTEAWVLNLVRNDHDPPVYPDDRLSHAFCAFCAHDETCDDGACSDGTSELQKEMERESK